VLEQHLPADDEQNRNDFYLFQAQLLENLQTDRRYGSTEGTRAERARIVDNLNRQALRLAGLSFVDLCLGKIMAP
jgi:hypothetical protein